jgi:hypothetical protein
MSDEHGAPADFGGRVFPNPDNIEPVLDTDIKPRVDEPSGDAKMSIENAPLKTPKGDTHNPPKVKVAPDAPKLRRLPKHTKIYDQGGRVEAPKKDTKMAEMNPYAKVTSGDKKPKKEIHKIVTHKTDDGKWIHTHQHHHPEHHKEETHVSTSMSDVHKHMDDHLGTPNAGEDASAAGAPAPMTAQPSPMPAPAAGAAPMVGM